MSMPRKNNLVLISVLSALVFFSGMWISETDAEGSGDVGSIAFLDLSKVINSNKKLLAAKQEINEFLKRGEAELKTLQQEMEELANGLMVYSQESPEYIEGQNELERKELGLKQQKRTLLIESDDRMGLSIKQAYQEIEKAVAEYAEVHDLDAVFTYKQGIEELQSNRYEDIMSWMSMVEVVWKQDRLDITDAIITIVNGN